mgnify:CR=1 FL=1
MEGFGRFTLDRAPRGGLVLVAADGCRIEGVVPVRPFPVSGPATMVVLCDSHGHELLCIDDLRTLDAATQQLVSDELAHREFVPVVTRVEQVYADTDPSEWQIETDRGRTSFLMNDDDTDVRRLGPHQILLCDTHGIRYLIPDIRELDAASRRILDRYV